MKIATRMLKLKDGASQANVSIDIFAPEKDGDAWMCRYDIRWPRETWSSSASGFDSTQALVLVLQKIGSDLYASDYHKSGQLFWDRSGNGYGFPVPHNARGDLVGDDKKYF